MVTMDEIREFAEKQMREQDDTPDEELIYLDVPEDYEEYGIVNPWFDPIEQKELTDDEAKALWGEEALSTFVDDVKDRLEAEELS